MRKGEWRAPWAAEVVDPVTGQVTKDPSAMVQLGQTLNQVVEERVRLAEFAHLRQQGWTPKAAAEQVFKTHFDYERGSSEFMKNVGSQALLFPTFTSHNLPKQFLQAMESPGKQVAPIRFTGAMRPEEPQGYVPQYLAQGGLAIPLPSEGLPEGQQRFLSRLGLPLEEAAGHIATGPTPLATLQRTGQGFLSMLNPALKLPLEYFSGTQLHTGRKLEDLHPGAVQSLGGLLGPDTTVAISEALSATPLSRIVSTANRLMDPRKMTVGGEVGNLAGLATGLRTTDVDIEKWRRIDAMRQLQDQMARSPHLRSSVSYYAPKDLKEELTPDEIQQMETMKLLQKQGREAKKIGLQTLSQANM